MRVLAMDPGKRNWAWALLEDGVVLEYNMLSDILTGLTVEEYQKQLPAIKAEIAKLIKFCNLNPKTDYICAERFMHRPGMGQGAVSEYINIQLGLITAWADPLEVYLISSAKWKNFMDANYNKTEEKMEMVKLLDPRGKFKLTTHESDAIGIGLYCFEFEKKRSFIKSCMKNIKPGT